MARYEFLSTWCVEAPIEQVWDAIYDAERWPEWWRGVAFATKLRDGDENDIGCIWRLGWRARLPYTLEFESETTRVDRPRLMEGVTRGELNGVGIWRFYEGAAGTAAVYEWNVRTTRRWMNGLAPVARPVFIHNHDVIMRRGAEGLARLLGVRLVASG
jgi:Polyketide cyclase / dehydrase and lipid transport